MPTDPYEFMRSRLGEEGRYFEYLGENIDLFEEVVVPRAARKNFSEVLREHIEKAAVWANVVADLKNILTDREAAYQEILQLSFVQACNTLEANERKELEECLEDEDEAQLDDFRRKKALKERLQSGPSRKVRWRRNYTEAYAWGWTHGMAAVQAAKSKRDKAKQRLNIADAMLTAMEHRLRCLGHLNRRESE